MVGKTGDELDYLNNEDSPRKNSGHKMASWEKSWALFMIDGDLPSGKLSHSELENPPCL